MSIREKLKTISFIGVLKKYWSFLVAALVIAIFLYIGRDAKTIIVEKDNSDLIQEVKKLRDDKGKLYSQLTTAVITKNEALSRADSFARRLNVKASQVKGEDRYYYKTDTVFSQKEVYIDTSKSGKRYYTVSQKDPWLRISAVAGEDTNSISFQQYDTITRVEVVKAPLIGRVRRTTNVFNSNPHSQLYKGYSWQVKEKDVFLSIGPYAGYDPVNRRPSVGVAVQIPIIKFRR